MTHFSARWQGSLTVPEDGYYKIGVEGDYGFRLILDGKTVVHDWAVGAARYKAITVALRKGQMVML